MEDKLECTEKPKVLILRPSGECTGSLAEHAITAHIPVIDIEPIPGAETKVVEMLEKCEWLILTSPRAPRILSRFAERLRELKARGMLKIAVIGPKTLEELARIGLEADLTPSEYRGASLAKELARLKPRCVVAARSEKALPELVEELEKSGVEVVEIPLYRVKILDSMAYIAASIADNFDYIVFTSPSIVEAFMKYYEKRGKPGFIPVAIGPTTAEKLAESGLAIVYYPTEYTMDSVAKLIQKLELEKCSSNPA